MRHRTLALPLLAAGLAGCSSSIDDGKAEKAVSKLVESQIAVQVKSVKCPSGLTAKKGDTFACTVRAQDGSTGKAIVTEKDDKGNGRVSAPFFHAPTVKRLEGLMATDISRQVGGQVTLTCPQLITAQRGGTFSCDATDGTKTRTVRVTQKDARGNVDYKLL